MLQHVRHLFKRLALFGMTEAALLSAAVVICLLGFAFIKLTDEVADGDTHDFDEWVLRSLRKSDDLAIPIGPAWLQEASQDVTALGSPVIVLLMLASVVGFMRMIRQYRLMFFTVITTSLGAALSLLLKHLIGRDRPSVVPHLREVASSSFPSGHAMLSAVVYLTLGILLTEVLPGRAVRIYCLLWAMSLSLIVGASRVYLGVHYPTDVLAGWIAGGGWALACWAVAHYLRRHSADTT